MSDGRAILANTGFLTIARLVDRLSGFVLAMFIAHSLGVSALGLYTASLAYYGLIRTAGALGVSTMLTREIGRDRANTNRYVLHGSLLAVASSLVLAAVALGILGALEGESDLRTNIGIVVLAIVPAIVNGVQEATFIAHQRVKLRTYVTFASANINVGAGLGLLLTGHGIRALLVLFVVMHYLVAVVNFALISRYVNRLHWEFDRTFMRTFLRDLRPFAGVTLLSAVFARPEVIILSLIADAEAVGYYGAATRLADVCSEIPNVFMANVFPVLSRYYDQADARFATLRDDVVHYLLVFSLPLGFGIFATAGPLSDALYGSKFADAVVPLRILAVGVPVAAIWTVLWRILAARGEQGNVLRVQIVTTVVRLGGGVVLIALFGVVGAALALVAAFTVHALLLARYVRADGSRLDVWRLGRAPALAASVMGVVAWAAALVLAIWLVVPLAAAVYVGLMVHLETRERGGLDGLRRMIRGRRPVDVSADR